MFNKKLFSGILSAALLLSTVSVAASGFKDVDNDPTVSWAVPYISEMTEKGYIKGYEDGTFKPNNTISKTEALILLSRMIGVNDEDYAGSVAFAVDEFSSTLSQYATNYAREISFLLYAGILDADELDTYISSTNKNSPLKRYEAAILLTKLLGAEEEVSTNAFVSSSYADTVEIPDSARAYVEYVKEQGIMQGMGNNDNGEPIFSPNTAVTRSQMAKMLCCLIDVIDLSTKFGSIVSKDAFNETITINIDGKDAVIEYSDATKYKINGSDVALDKLKKNMYVQITCIAGKAALVEHQITIEDSVIYGLVYSTKDSQGTQTVVLTDVNDPTKKDTYILADAAKIKVNGAIDLFGKVKNGNYVALTIEDGFVVMLEVIDKTETVYGTLEYVDITGEFTVLTVKVNEGSSTEYEVSANEIDVLRNGKVSNLSELMVGDTVSLKLTYGKITKVQASSKTQKNEGIINYITYSVNGTNIGIEINGEVTDYKVNKSVKVLIDSSDNATVYDLRPGTDISFTLQSQELVNIEAASVVAKSQLTGLVKSVNSTYGLLVIEENGTEFNVFVNSSTKIIDSVSGKTITIKNIDKNRTASVTGSNSSGVLEASVIVLQ